MINHLNRSQSSITTMFSKYCTILEMKYHSTPRRLMPFCPPHWTATPRYVGIFCMCASVPGPTLIVQLHQQSSHH